MVKAFGKTFMVKREELSTYITVATEAAGNGFFAVGLFPTVKVSSYKMKEKSVKR